MLVTPTPAILSDLSSRGFLQGPYPEPCGAGGLLLTLGSLGLKELEGPTPGPIRPPWFPPTASLLFPSPSAPACSTPPSAHGCTKKALRLNQPPTLRSNLHHLLWVFFPCSMVSGLCHSLHKTGAHLWASHAVFKWFNHRVLFWTLDFFYTNRSLLLIVLLRSSNFIK